ncbi:heme o synthase [Bartonella tamiae]|uniref:Protoheme IX farnesyltransferase n=1 Tax=Bartonella tamiae Th239 TaxID=1094558 RepID=J1JZI9_9HYPH|nr:heme o synthase [Bartonella tamiae]EJF90537.1 protoheme IX farnesyltransferase [Bartonella tamiae Th239]EJF93519.1 protoheme IX farnesyltransferase [Bartonella tamiae Th307]
MSVLHPIKKNVVDEPSEANAHDYMTLLKPRVMSLVVFTALVGLLVAPSSINPIIGFIAIFCIAVGGGASGALNMWYDADIDAIMKRTQKRAIPSGKLKPKEVFIFGIVLSIFSVLTMGIFVNWFSAAFLAFTIFFYVVIYTMWLKRITPQNIVIGGASGAFPPMIGWAAATGTISVDSCILFLIIFMWTPPHFWALSLFAKTDYGAAKIPMMPNVRGEKSTKNQILVYAILMALCGVLPSIMGFAGLFYGVLSALLGIIFVYRAFYLWKVVDKEKTIFAAKKLFFFSLIYLFAIFAVLLIESTVLRFMGYWG